MGMLQSLAVTMSLGLFGAGLFAWAVALRKLAHGEPLLPLEPRRPVPWGLADIAVLLLVYLSLNLLVVSVVRQFVDFTPGEPLNPTTAKALYLVDAAVKLPTLLLSGLFIALRTRASWRDLGVNTQRIADDLRLGMVAFFVIATPVYVLQVILLQFWPIEHPLISLLKEYPEPGLFLVSTISAVLVAPIVEEYFFRLVLQGWLESLRRGLTLDQWFVGQPPPSAKAPILAEVVSSDAIEPVVPLPAAPLGANPYASPAIVVDSPPPDAAIAATARPALWPMFLSALLFALAHWGHGPAPISLFFFAIGLGYLYRQTRRLLPCMVVHFLLNLYSMVLLLLQVLGE